MTAREILLLTDETSGIFGQLRWLQKLPDMGTQGTSKAEPSSRTQTVKGTWVWSDKSSEQLTGHVGF